MSFLFSNKNHKDGYYLTILLLEKEVSVFVTKVTGGKAEQIVSKDVRHTISVREGVSAQKLDKLKLILAKLFTIVHTEMARASGKRDARLSGAYVILSYPWFFSDEMHINLSGGNISLSEREVVRQIEERFTASEGKRAEPLKPVLLEYCVNDIKLNGYAVANPYDKKTDRVDISATTISIFPEIEHVVEVEVNAFFHSGKPVFLSLPKACSRRQPAVYIVMDSSNTLIVNSRQDGSYRVKDISIGVEEIVKAAVEVFGAESQESALSYLRMAKEEVLANDISSAVIKSVKEKMVDWTFLVKEALAEFGEDAERPSPTVVYRRGLRTFTENFIKDELPLAKPPRLRELEEMVADPSSLSELA